MKEKERRKLRIPPKEVRTPNGNVVREGQVFTIPEMGDCKVVRVEMHFIVLEGGLSEGDRMVPKRDFLKAIDDGHIAYEKAKRQILSGRSAAGKRVRRR